MKSHHYPKQFNLKFAITGVAIALLTPSILISSSWDRLHAQIIPDNSLGNEASVLTPNVEIKGRTAERIDGGAVRDTNLFHSFEQFNIGDGQQVYFANPAEITNIFSRVTGSNLSEILGTLGVNGNANLFLINPNGIIFGENASLDVGGSFVGSTADAIQFGDRGFFSATEPEQPPLLTVKPSAFFFNQINPGRIENRSTAPAEVDLLETPLSGLRVPDGQSLLLVGGNIVIDGGGLHAPDGRVELAGVAGNETVGLNVDGNNLNLSFPEDLARADISLTNGAFVNTSGEGGGSIQVQGSNVTLSDRSFVFADTLGSQNGDGIVVRASQLRLEDGSKITANVTGSGQGGDLSIITGQLQLLIKDGAVVAASTFGEGNGGSLSVNASESVRVIGTSADGQFPSGLFSSSEGTGKAGDLKLTTGQLLVRDGAQVSTNTFGSGDGGSLSVNASESVRVIGTSADGQFGSILSADTLGTGKGGDLSITTRQLIVQDGAEVGASTRGEGDGGTLTVDASKSVQVIGRSADGQFPSGLFVQATPDSTGNAGDLRLETGSLTLRDGAEVSVKNQGAGDAGNLEVAARDLRLENQAALSATTTSGQGGNITLQIGDLLLLRRNSQISTTAGLAQRAGDGGNITIDADLIVAIPQENSDIRAQAFAGNGGNINIDAQNILGFQLLENPNFSDITASSQFGIDSTINIEPGQESIALPIEIVDVSKLIDRNLCSSEQKDEFIITGKGGLSPSPKDPLDTD
ncbi:MAG: filamentous hemagglutinin N-terminal domain-containing protein, partial [Pleurocapsa sp. MO_226.B13]|nr:filamentous hemagglutinin N-terminal domain-containing protein [Pleurocapsa sp. MO_226.B13]